MANKGGKIVDAVVREIRSGVARLAALGGVRRRGLGALKTYGGTLSGEGYIERNSGPKKGQREYFTIEGQPVSKN